MNVNLNIINIIKKEIKFSLDKLNIDFNFDKIIVEKSKQIKNGDFSSNIALMISGKNKLETAKEIVQCIKSDYFEKIDVMGPGFINFFISNKLNIELINSINDNSFFKYDDVKKKKINMEFVSANPTGFLHIGHARNATYGDMLCSIWEALGHDVVREYYINDAGNQIDKLGLSTLIRYLELCGKDVKLPDDAYHANEIKDIAKKLFEKHGKEFENTEYNNDCILNKKTAITIKQFAKNILLDILKQDLSDIGVVFDIWFSETSIYNENKIPATLNKFGNNIYESEGATWLKTTLYGDDKDRVLIKSDGSFTYFMPDICYHDIKMSRGYDSIYNVWGADHKSYADRMKIAMKLLGYDDSKINILIMQMIKLVKNGKEFKMSKRSGNSFTIKDLVDLIGEDALRWFTTSQSLSTHLEIDVERVKEQSSENPLYYVMYAVARISQLLKKADFKFLKPDLHLLSRDTEKELISQLYFYKNTLINIGNTCEVHKLSLYLYNLAKLFHSFYSTNVIIDSNNKELSHQRLLLSNAVQQVIKNALSIMKIKCKNSM